MIEKIGLVDGDKFQMDFIVHFSELVESKDGFLFLKLPKFKKMIESCRVFVLPPEKIKAMIKKMAQESIGSTVGNIEFLAKYDALRWVLGQISDKDFGLEE